MRRKSVHFDALWNKTREWARASNYALHHVCSAQSQLSIYIIRDDCPHAKKTLGWLVIDIQLLWPIAWWMILLTALDLSRIGQKYSNSEDSWATMHIPFIVAKKITVHSVNMVSIDCIQKWMRLLYRRRALWILQSIYLKSFVTICQSNGYLFGLMLLLGGSGYDDDGGGGSIRNTSINFIIIIIILFSYPVPPNRHLHHHHHHQHQKRNTLKTRNFND